MSSPFRRTTLAGATVLAFVAAGGAEAQTRTFSIPAEPAARAIAEFARQSGLQIVAPTGQLRDVTTQAVGGQLEPREALRRLLVNTGLEVSSDSGAVIVLRMSPRPAAPPQPEPAPAPRPLRPPLPPQTAAPGALEEVVVTAQKRSENLQKVPLAVTALDAQSVMARGGQTVQAMEGMAPNVEINASNAATGIAIRGVFSTNDGPQGDPAVAYHVDGVYLGRPQSIGGLLFDLDHIEVLRGPQGTLYGRNATAGALNVVTARPSWKSGAGLGAEAGNYGLQGIGGMLNLPLGDVAALRLAGRSVARGGYAADGRTDDLKEAAARAQLLIEPHRHVSLLLAADYDRRRGVGTAAYNLETAGVAPRSANFPNPGAHISNENWGVRGELNWDLGFASLTVLPAYHHFAMDYLYASNRRIQQFQSARQRSVEARLTSPADQPFSWIVGAFYWQELQDSFQTLIPPPTTVLFGYPDIRSYSRAVFGQVTYGLSDRLRLTGGLRYTQDTKKQRGATEVRQLSGALSSNVSNLANASWEALNWKAAAEYDLAPHSLLYAMAATGYKAGGNFDGLPPNTYEPERVRSLEAGSKNRFLDSRLQLNLTAFHYAYEDYQASQLGCLNLPTGLPACTASGRITYNADAASVYGVELESQWAITAADRLNLMAAYIHSGFDAFVLPVTPFSTGGDFAGNPLPKSPRRQVSLEYSHTFDLPGGGSVTTGGRWRWVSEQYLLFDIRNPQVRQPAYDMGDLLVTWRDAGGRLELSGYLNNMADTLVKAYAFASSTPGTFYGTYLPPRSYGLRLNVNF